MDLPDILPVIDWKEMYDFAPVHPILEPPVIRLDDIIASYGIPVSLQGVRPFHTPMQILEVVDRINWRHEGF